MENIQAAWPSRLLLLVLLLGLAAAARDISLQARACASPADLQSAKDPIGVRLGWDNIVFAGEWGPSNIGALGSGPEAQARAQLNGMADQVNRLGGDLKRRWAEALAPQKSAVQAEMERFARAAAISVGPTPVTVGAKITLGTLVLQCASGAPDSKRFVPYIALGSDGGGEQPLSSSASDDGSGGGGEATTPPPPPAPRAALSSSSPGRYSSLPQDATYRGEIFCLGPAPPTGQGGTVPVTIQITRDSFDGAILEFSSEVEFWGQRCEWSNRASCRMSRQQFCRDGKEAWDCSVTHTGEWTDPCFGDPSPKATRASFCYKDGEVEVKEMSPTCKVVSGTLSQSR